MQGILGYSSNMYVGIFLVRKSKDLCFLQTIVFSHHYTDFKIFKLIISMAL